MCANPLLPMEKEFNTHDQTGVMNTLREWSTSSFFLDLKSLGQDLTQKRPFICEGTKDNIVLTQRRELLLSSISPGTSYTFMFITLWLSSPGSIGYEHYILPPPKKQSAEHPNHSDIYSVSYSLQITSNLTGTYLSLLFLV